MPLERAEFLARAWTKPEERDGKTSYVLAFDPRHRNVNPVMFRREEAEALLAAARRAGAAGAR